MATKQEERMQRVIQILEREGLVPDGQTATQRVRIPTMKSPVFGKSGGEPRTLGGRARYARPGTSLRVTVGPRTVNVYLLKGDQGVEFLANLKTSDDDLETLLPKLCFVPTHEFHLDDGTIVRVRAELRGDWVAFEADGTPWHTNLGDTAVWWDCSARNVSKVRRVIKYGHRFRTRPLNEKSHRFECECGVWGSMVRSEARAVELGEQHHRDAVRVEGS